MYPRAIGYFPCAILVPFGLRVVREGRRQLLGAVPLLAGTAVHVLFLTRDFLYRDDLLVHPCLYSDHGLCLRELRYV